MFDLGIVPHLCGSIIQLLVWGTGLPASRDRRVSHVWRVLTEYYEKFGTPAGERLPHALFTGMFDRSRGRFSPTDFPDLHSTWGDR